MKISDIIVEEINQDEANQVLQSLIAAGDPTARYFQITRYQTVHTTIDSAQRAAERMYHRDRELAVARANEREKRQQDKDSNDKPEQPTMTGSDKDRIGKTGKKWGNQYYADSPRGKLRRLAKALSTGDTKASYQTGKEIGTFTPFDAQIDRKK